MASAAIESGRDGEARGFPTAALLFIAAAIASVALVFWTVRDPVFSGLFLAGLIGGGGLLALTGRRAAPQVEPADIPARADIALLREALDAAGGDVALAITGPDLALIAANPAFTGTYGAPAEIGSIGDAATGSALQAAAIAARRDGQASVGGLVLGGSAALVEVRAAAGGDALVWRIARPEQGDLTREAHRLITGAGGTRLGEAGIMVALTDDRGRIVSANRVFSIRATGDDNGDVAGTEMVQHIAATAKGSFHFASEGRAGTPLRILHVPLGASEDELSLFLLLDELNAAGAAGEEGIHILLEHIPLGLALADVDGRFTFMNRSFRKAAGLGPQEMVAWPGDLVVDEDKGAVSDFVHRFARGRGSMNGDIAVRLHDNPDEPIALTVAGARGLGNAAVLLSLKDNSEEVRLKREIAQATKMQAVGQLAGGVAHDFNNILTAMLGTCDLMLMRHMPGDPDYDDIQQIRSNSNRAANLTRQLLAFSRQQTLRPQVLQLPDVVSEVSHLLHRLLGETVELKVKHGRGLGAVRADPGQLEQVIVNLAVNARDAMQANDAGPGQRVGTLSIETFAVSPDDVRRMGSDILPIADYTALKVADTGTGIPPQILSKIFEPFFTTKEVGKGTGLGLSTVYGIVKQSGGFIFADSEMGQGTAFTIYLPVHHAPASEPQPVPPKAKAAEAKSPNGSEYWGTGNILLVEDEAMVRAVAERALTRHGYNVMVAETGEMALEMLANAGDVDLMISDVVMPTMDGPTTVRHARETRPDLPILFISGYAEEQLRKSIQIENVNFLPKPFSVQQLAQTVHGILTEK